eukprot:3843065-Alexandrium_andersonii.AAC.1
MPPRHFGRRPAPSRSRSPHPTSAEQGRRLRAEQPTGQSLIQAGFPDEARTVAQADRVAFRAVLRQGGRARAVGPVH